MKTNHVRNYLLNFCKKKHKIPIVDFSWSRMDLID